MRRRTNSRKLPETWKPQVLQAIARGMTVKDAAESVGVGRRTIYSAAEQDPAFAEGMHQAYDESADVLEAEARRRAVDGTVRKKFHDGQPIIDPETGQQYIEREYSDTLLIFLLKGRRPEVFGDRPKVDHGGKVIVSPEDRSHTIGIIRDRLGRITGSN
jgi:hypothetical protein